MCDTTAILSLIDFDDVDPRIQGAIQDLSHVVESTCLAPYPSSCDIGELVAELKESGCNLGKILVPRISGSYNFYLYLNDDGVYLLSASTTLNNYRVSAEII
jgi:hypothetical protein